MRASDEYECLDKNVKARQVRLAVAALHQLRYEGIYHTPKDISKNRFRGMVKAVDKYESTDEMLLDLFNITVA